MATTKDPKTEALHGASSRMVAADQKARYRSFIPVVGGMVVVTLPGEIMRCPVRKVVNDDTVVIELDAPPVSRTHTFRFRELYGARRRREVDGREFWELQYDSDFLREQERISNAAKEGRQAAAPKIVAKPPAKKQAAPKKETASKKAAAPKKAAKRKRKAA